MYVYVPCNDDCCVLLGANLTLTQRNMMGMEGDVVEVCVAHAHTLEDSVSVLLTLITGTGTS